MDDRERSLLMEMFKKSTPQSVLGAPITGYAPQPPEDQQLVGPPDPIEYAPQPIEGREQESPDGFGDLIKEISPLLLAQGVDALSTEIVNRRGAQPNESGIPWSQHEGNPIPGMGSTLGRVGINTAENVLMHLLRKKFPKIGKVADTAAIIGHTTLGRGNWRSYDESEPYHKFVHPFLVDK